MAAIAFVVVVLLSVCPSISARASGDLASPAHPKAAAQQPTQEGTVAIPLQSQAEPPADEPQGQPKEGEEIQEEPPPEDANTPPTETPKEPPQRR